MRILLQSNAPWVNTGYGVLAKELLPRWKKMGHDVACFAFNGLYGGQLVLDGIPMFPLGKEMWGRDKMEFYNKLWNADIYMTFLDVWAIPEIATMNLRWVPYVFVDHDPSHEPMNNVLRGAYRIAVASENGKKLLGDASIESVPIWNGVDTKIYKPTENKKEARQKLGFDENDFVIGVVAMNKGVRKNFPDMFEMFKRFQKRHINARLYLHTDPMRPDGMDLMRMAQVLGIQNYIALSDTNLLELGYPAEKMAELYQGFDVTLMNTAGEGFGLPIIESQACGVPVITNDFTTGKELNAHESLVVPVGRKYMDNLMSYQALTDLDEAVKKLESIYSNGSESYKDVCVEFTKKFDWDEVAKSWEMFFSDIEKDLKLNKKE